MDLRIAREAAANEVNRQQVASAEIETVLRGMAPAVDARKALVEAKKQLATIREMRERYQQAFPVRSKLGVGQPRAFLPGEDQPRLINQAERKAQTRVAGYERRSREVESSPWLRLQASELAREAAADRSAAKAVLDAVEQELKKREKSIAQEPPEARTARLRQLQIESLLARVLPGLRREDATEAVPSVQLARQQYEEAEALKRMCAAKRAEFRERHPIKAKLGLQEPRIDDPISGRKNCRLSEIEKGLKQLLTQRHAVLAAIRSSEPTKAAADALLLASEQQRTRAAERDRMLGQMLAPSMPIRGLQNSLDEERFGRQSPGLER